MFRLKIANKSNDVERIDQGKEIDVVEGDNNERGQMVGGEIDVVEMENKKRGDKILVRREGDNNERVHKKSYTPKGKGHLEEKTLVRGSVDVVLERDNNERGRDKTLVRRDGNIKEGVQIVQGDVNALEGNNDERGESKLESMIEYFAESEGVSDAVDCFSLVPSRIKENMEGEDETMMRASVVVVEENIEGEEFDTLPDLLYSWEESEVSSLGKDHQLNIGGATGNLSSDEGYDSCCSGCNLCNERISDVSPLASIHTLILNTDCDNTNEGVVNSSDVELVMSQVQLCTRDQGNIYIYKYTNICISKNSDFSF